MPNDLTPMNVHRTYGLSTCLRLPAGTSVTGIRPLFPTPSATPEGIDLRKILDPALLGVLVLDLLLIIGLVLRG